LWLVLRRGVMVDGVGCGIMRNFVHKYHSNYIRLWWVCWGGNSLLRLR